MSLKNCSMDELQEMADAAFSEYYRLAVAPCGTQPKKSELRKLQKATDKYEEIREEIVSRL